MCHSIAIFCEHDMREILARLEAEVVLDLSAFRRYNTSSRFLRFIQGVSMPLLPNAKKALRVAERKAVVNRRIKSRVKTMLDNAKKSPSAENIALAYSAVDKAVKRNIFHRNKAARLKSQVSRQVAAK